MVDRGSFFAILEIEFDNYETVFLYTFLRWMYKLK